MIHGASSNLLELWGPLAAEFSPLHRVIAYDRPGMGHSTRARRDAERIGSNMMTGIRYGWCWSVVLCVALVGCGGGGGGEKGGEGGKLPRRVMKPPKAPPEAPVRVDTPIDAQLQSLAKAELVRGAESTTPLIRAHALELMRDANLERPIDAGRGADDTSEALCAHLTGGLTRPSVAAARGEARARLGQALAGMDPTDREVLALRHFEQLSNAETAQVLDLHESAASKRYLRALKKLKEILTDPTGRNRGVSS